MKCAHCHAEARVLGTRTPEEHLIVRTHQCEAGHKFRTVQVLESVYKAQRKVLDGARKRVSSGTARRRAVSEKRETIRKMLAKGLSQAEIARQTGYSQSAVSRAVSSFGMGKKRAAAVWFGGL